SVARNLAPSLDASADRRPPKQAPQSAGREIQSGRATMLALKSASLSHVGGKTTAPVVERITPAARRWAFAARLLFRDEAATGGRIGIDGEEREPEPALVNRNTTVKYSAG